MLHDRLAQDLYTEICRLPLIDAHSHIDPLQPTARTLDDILSYHYFTELAHSSGMPIADVGPDVDPRDRVRHVIYHMAYFDNTTPYQWFLELARSLFDFQGDRVTLADATWLYDRAGKQMARPDWEAFVRRRFNLEKVVVARNFDETLDGFDVERYVPCLRANDLLFHLDQPEVWQRLQKATGIEVSDPATLRRAITKLFEHFTGHGAKACALSLPPHFVPTRDEFEPALSQHITAFARGTPVTHPRSALDRLGRGVFWILAEHCRDFGLPFCLRIGVNRNVYQHGVPHGQDLFDHRTSLTQYAELFNAFPEVTFPVSVLTSTQNQDLVGYSWIFPNVVTNGHWWYGNVPAYIEHDLRARLQAVPKVKQIGFYSDANKLEFCLPKFTMYRRSLAQVLADDYIRPRLCTEGQALQLARLLLYENVKRIFDL